MFRSPLQTSAEPCRATLVVLDFDGTLTDADAHAPVFHEASRRELARRLGWDEPRLQPEWERAREAVAALPPEAAWVVDDHPACPAAGDPYLVANSVAKRLLSKHRPGLEDVELTAEVLEVHRAAYEGALPPFRAEARGVLEELCGRVRHVRVVTNSRTRTVERLLDSLGCRCRERLVVRGDAGKFSVCGSATADARFGSLPETVTWPELGREVHLRRGRYFDVLRGMWDETGTGPASTLVVGDVFELDLAMPAALGAHAQLVLRAGTMPHERRLARRLARGDADERLAAVLDRLRD